MACQRLDGTLIGMGGAEESIDLTYDYVGTELVGAPLADYDYSNNVVAIGGDGTINEVLL